jgi:hypothetical protein
MICLLADALDAAVVNCSVHPAAALANAKSNGLPNMTVFYLFHYNILSHSIFPLHLAAAKAKQQSNSFTITKLAHNGRSHKISEYIAGAAI